MSVTSFTEAVNIIGSLGDNPNTDNNLSAAELKAMFDKAPELIKEYLNGTLVPAVQALENAVSLLSGGVIQESVEYPGCYYRMVDGEQEWINPPMVTNVEYRTAERMNGKTVYAKRLGVTIDSPESGSVTVDTGIQRIINQIEEISGVMKCGAMLYSLPWNVGSSVYMRASMSNNLKINWVLELDHSADFDGTNGFVTIKWTSVF